MRKIKFDLEMAKRIINGESNGKIITQTGREVEILKTDLECSTGQCILGVLKGNKSTGEDTVKTYYSNGMVNKDLDKPTLFDLEIEVEERDYYLMPGKIILFRTNFRKDSIIMGIIEKVENNILFLMASCDVISVKNKAFGPIYLHKETQSFCRLDEVIEFLEVDEDLEERVVIELNNQDISWTMGEGKYVFTSIYQCFEAGDKVIGVDGAGQWRFDFFSHKDFKGFVCTGRTYQRLLKFNDYTKNFLG